VSKFRNYSKKEVEGNTHWLDASEFLMPEAERTSVCARDRWSKKLITLRQQAIATK